MKKLFSTFIFVLISFYPLSLNISAQDDIQQIQEELAETDRPAEINDSQQLRAEFIQKTQNTRSKEAQFEMVLTSQISSDRVRVEWVVTGSSIIKNPESVVILKNKEFDTRRLEGDMSIRPKEKYVIPITIQPTGYGVTEIFGTVRAVGVDSTVITTVRKNFATNEKREILPLTDAYKNAVTQMRILDIIKIIGLILLIPVALFFGLKRFSKWLNKDEVR